MPRPHANTQAVVIGGPYIDLASPDASRVRAGTGARPYAPALPLSSSQMMPVLTRSRFGALTVLRP
jgi:hypothetical protein